MTADQRAALVRRHAPLVLAVLLLGLVAATAWSALATRVYASQTQLFVSAGAAADAGGANERGLFAQSRVKSYLTLASSPLVLNPVIAQLGLATTPERLAESIATSSPPDTVLLEITARAGTAAGAQQLAGAVSTQLARVVAGLERETGTASSVTLSVVRPAQRPDAPVEPRPARALLFAGVFALASGVGLAALRERLDPRVATRAEAESVAGAPVLAMITRDRLAGRHPLVNEGGSPARLEDFRRLRARLALHRTKGLALLVTSPSRGAGRTTTALNLALVLAESGTTVAVLDGDRVRPAVHTYLGLPPGPGMSDVVAGRVGVEEAFTTGPGGIVVLRSGEAARPATAQPAATDRDLQELLREARDRVDVVLVDCSSVVESAEALRLARLLDGVLLVVAQAASSPDQLGDAVAAITGADGLLTGVVLNRASGGGRWRRPPAADLADRPSRRPGPQHSLAVRPPADAPAVPNHVMARHD